MVRVLQFNFNVLFDLVLRRRLILDIFTIYSLIEHVHPDFFATPFFW